MGSKYTGFHVNFRAFFVDEINGRTTGFGGAEFDFRVYLTVPLARLGPMSGLSPLYTIPMALRPGPDRRIARAVLAHTSIFCLTSGCEICYKEDYRCRWIFDP